MSKFLFTIYLAYLLIVSLTSALLTFLVTVAVCVAPFFLAFAVFGIIRAILS